MTKESPVSGLLPVPESAREFHRERLRSRLESWAGRVPTAILLTGPSGVGKRSMAHWLAQWVLCEGRAGASRQDEEQGGLAFGGDLFGGSPPASAVDGAAVSASEPCGKCGSCARMLAGSNVNLVELRPEAEEGREESGTLKVEQLRDLKASAGRGGFESAHKVVVIPRAQQMTAQAANSLLKLLEEPPRGWVFVLTANDPTLVLPTILSRCQQARLAPLPFVTLVELLRGEGIPPARAEAAARLGMGSWKRASALASDEAWAQRKEIAEFMQKPAASLTTLVDRASATQESFLFVADTLETILVDFVRERQGLAQDGWLNADLAAGLKPLVAKRSETFCLERIERIGRARREVLAPLNRKLLAQDLLLPFLA